MKRLWPILITTLVAHVGGQFSVRAALAPDELTKSVSFLSGALTQFMSDSRTFSATTDLTVQQTGAPDSRVRLRFGSAFDTGKMRFDLNFKDEVNAALGTGMPHLGIDRVMIVMFPSHPARIVFPSQQAYVEMPLDKPATPKIKDQAIIESSRLQKKLVGREAVNGVATKKYQLHADGSSRTAYLWESESADLMPMQLRVQSGGMVYNFAFRNVRQGRLDPRVFGIPSTFTKKNGIGDVIQMSVAKIAEQLDPTR